LRLQIIDLSSDYVVSSSSNGHSDGQGEVPPAPLIAFEENLIAAPKQEVTTAGEIKMMAPGGGGRCYDLQIFCKKEFFLKKNNVMVTDPLHDLALL
jgi:hypothetical protein